jgi:diguanylate cyclase (GGDEF)-like protein
MATTEKDKILLVDDELLVLQSLSLQLRRRYDVLTASTGPEALKLIEKHQDISAIISDMRMPEMDGATVLSHAYRLIPEAARILLTGQADASAAARAVNQGHVHYFLAKPCPPQELIAALDQGIEQWRSAQLTRTNLVRQLEANLDSRDPRSGLVNRRRFCADLEQCTKRLEHGDRACALFMIKIESIEQASALHGHEWADQVMQAATRRLISVATEAQTVARWSDTQFAILTAVLPNGPADCERQADALLRAMTAPVAVNGITTELNVHVGATVMPADTRDPAAALRFAEIALLQARKQAANAVCRFRAEWAEDIATRQQLVAALREAIAADAMELHYQPIVDVSQRRVHAFEALARWMHPSLGFIPPAQFIPLAEESGEMPRLGEWIIQRACREAKQLLGGGERIAINLSVEQLRSPDFTTFLRKTLAANDLACGDVELELTESVFLSEAEEAIASLRELRTQGFRIALDDFGTGYSSLSYLQRLPISAIKIDRSFILEPERNEPIILAALELGRSYQIDVTFEGVERDETLHWLVERGARMIQGYLLGRPMPLKSIGAWRQDAGMSAPHPPNTAAG